jgi:acetolactate synthase-1/2/3 large subunit
MMAGHGIRLAGAADLFIELVERLNIPVVTAICGHDLIWSDHPLFFGRPGICGDRLGNLVLQNSDLMLAIGARLGVRQVSYNYEAFARAAYRAMVDIDPTELKKPTLKLHMPVHADARFFIQEMLQQLGEKTLAPKSEWLGWCEERKRTLPNIIDENSSGASYVNSYEFADILFKQLLPGAVVVTGNGTAYTGTFQVMQIKNGVRVFTNQGCASMGYDLPAAIGACIALDKKPVVLITGDGSLQMNAQEWQTVAGYGLPIKTFVINNDGYLSIRITQDTYFEGRHIGSQSEGKLFLPDVCKVAEAYGIPAMRVYGGDNLAAKIQEVLASPGPQLCEIMMDPKQTLYPKLSSVVNFDGSMVSRPLEDMYPFLPRDEFRKSMLIPPLEQG